jgi:hypothetical protein
MQLKREASRDVFHTLSTTLLYITSIIGTNGAENEERADRVGAARHLYSIEPLACFNCRWA